MRRLPSPTPITARAEHGGELVQGKRKLARPLDPTRPLQLVLRSERARGRWFLLAGRNRRRVAHEASRAATRFGLRILHFENRGSSLHLVLRLRRRADFQAFLKTFSGLAARAVTGARKGRPVGRFWSGLAFSRVLEAEEGPFPPPREAQSPKRRLSIRARGRSRAPPAKGRARDGP